jgi:decaprenyl-phosphate phosphoribosyltransferase
MLKRIQLLFQIIRVRDWAKNIVILFPLIFSGKVLSFKVEQSSEILINISSFLLLTSIVYILNDIKDIPQDALNPHKSKRPIASGEVSVAHALVIVICLLSGILINLFLFGFNFLEYYIFYFLNNIIYNFYLKKINIVNSLSIAFGFLIRLFFGAELSNVPLEPWLIVLVLLGTFLLSLIKKLSDKKNMIGVDKLLKQDYLFINSSIICMVIVYTIHFYFSVEFNIINQLISSLLFVLTLLIIRRNIKKITHSIDTFQILSMDSNLIISLFLWFTHYYFYRYL